MRDIVYFDLETRHSAAEVGGWHNTAEMRMSVGVTYSTASGKYAIYSEEMVDDLITQLRQADLVVGYNHEHFDYGVLQRYTMWNMADITNNLDLCRDIEQRGGVRVKLDSVAAASIGSLLRRRWQPRPAVGECTGNVELLMDIARYCCFDVKVTRDVHWYGAEHGFIRYDDKKGGTVELPVDLKLKPFPSRNGMNDEMAGLWLIPLGLPGVGILEGVGFQLF